MAIMSPAQIDGLPNICGYEAAIADVMGCDGPIYLPDSGIDFGGIRSCFTCALHMHQPLIPAGGDDLETARVIGNLQYMFEHRDEGDNHNAPVFHWCYKRIGEFIAQLLDEGAQPRIMLEYSGCLLHGLWQMGLRDVFDQLRTVTLDPGHRRCVEWLGMPWGHPVAPSTPVQDFRLHVRAWQHHFAALFGLEALGRVRGFSLSEMALPNHPDVCYEFVKTLKDCGYRWLLVQEQTVERLDGRGITFAHEPHQLVVRNSQGQTLSIVAIIKTQGSDIKLIGQMQPYYEAKDLLRVERDGKSVPPMVAQIADGENGGVMMNEFPSKYMEVMHEASHSATPPVNVSEYLEYLESIGLNEAHFPAIQPIMQHRIWERLDQGAGPDQLADVIKQLEREDDRFHVEGGSWTSDRSWVQGYDNVLSAMEQASVLFARKVLDRGVTTDDPRYRNALFHLLCSQTSCYRYWGEGRWTDYGRELCRRTMDILNCDF